MKKFSITIRFEMNDWRFRDSHEFYDYLLQVFSRDRTVLQMTVIDDDR